MVEMHGVHVSVSRQIVGMSHLRYTWIAPHEQYVDIFFFYLFIFVLLWNSRPE